MTKKELYRIALDYLQAQSPATDTELYYASPFQLLVAVVLSAQCTDKRVNQITPELFAKYPTATIMAKASPEDIFEYIHSVSYPNSKSHYLVGLSQMLVSQYHEEVPDTIEELTQLPGVGRKTANVIQALVYGKPALAVDTHVFRVSHRLGLVTSKATTPYKTEKELVGHIPEEQVTRAHFWLLYYGRYTCTSRAPKCKTCGLADICKFHGQQEKKKKPADTAQTT